MNLLLVEPGEMDQGGRVRLSDRRAQHAREVIGVTPGSELRVGVVRGRRGRATVIEVSDDEVVLEVALDGPEPTRPAVDVVLALPRPKALMRAIETCASFGVDRIDIVNAWRVDKSFFHSSRVSESALRHHLTLGCEQGQTTWRPVCRVHKLLVPFVRQELVARLDAEPGTARLVAHPRAEKHVEAAWRTAVAERAVVVVGPERGWIDRELEMFEELGFSPVRLGAPVLRTEAAIAALLAQLALLVRLGAP